MSLELQRLRRGVLEATDAGHLPTLFLFIERDPSAEDDGEPVQYDRVPDWDDANGPEPKGPDDYPDWAVVLVLKRRDETTPEAIARRKEVEAIMAAEEAKQRQGATKRRERIMDDEPTIIEGPLVKVRPRSEPIIKMGRRRPSRRAFH